MPKYQNREVFVCILNWGLGHATRMIPVIQRLEDEGYKVTMASDGRAQHLLRREFPHLNFINLPGYKVKYPFKSMFVNLMIQWPRVVLATIREYFVIRKYARQIKPALIISDNRYGCFYRPALNICVTHQVNPLTGSKLFNHLGARASRLLLSNFDKVWIPDDPGFGPLNGVMVSSPPSHARFIGFISRLRAFPAHDKAKVDILTIISGPEPARTRFEVALIQQLVRSPWTFKIVRGKTEGFNKWHTISENGQMIDFLTSQDMQKELSQTKVVISRSGYTSLMDYLVLGVKALIVPTPGQYEQEYLADNIPSSVPWVSQKEHQLDVVQAYDELMNKRPMPTYSGKLLDEALREVLVGSDERSISDRLFAQL